MDSFNVWSLIISSVLSFSALALSIFQEIRHRKENEVRFSILDTFIHLFDVGGSDFAAILFTVSNLSSSSLALERIRIQVDTSDAVRPLSTIEASTLWRDLSPERQEDREFVAFVRDSGLPTSIPAHGARRIAVLVRLESRVLLEPMLGLLVQSTNMQCKGSTGGQYRKDAPQFLCLSILVRGRIFHCFVAADILTFSDTRGVEPQP